MKTLIPYTLTELREHGLDKLAREREQSPTAYILVTIKAERGNAVAHFTFNGPRTLFRFAMLNHYPLKIVWSAEYTHTYRLWHTFVRFEELSQPFVGSYLIPAAKLEDTLEDWMKETATRRRQYEAFARKKAPSLSLTLEAHQLRDECIESYSSDEHSSVLYDEDYIGD